MALLALVAVHGMLPVVTVYLTRIVVNAPVVLDSSGAGVSLGSAALAIRLMGLLLLTDELMGSRAGCVRTTLAEQMQD